MLVNVRDWDVPGDLAPQAPEMAVVVCYNMPACLGNGNIVRKWNPQKSFEGRGNWCRGLRHELRIVCLPDGCHW